MDASPHSSVPLPLSPLQLFPSQSPCGAPDSEEPEFGVNIIFNLEDAFNDDDEEQEHLVYMQPQQKNEKAQETNQERSTSEWDSFILDLLTVKMKANIANAHLDNILGILNKYEFKLKDSNDLEKLLPKSTSSIYNHLGMNGSLGDWKTLRACVNRCCILPESATRCPVKSCKQDVSDEDIIFYHRK